MVIRRVSMSVYAGKHERSKLISYAVKVPTPTFARRKLHCPLDAQ